jgi:hypothetical protein
MLSGGGHQSSKRRFMTARVILMAVAFCEINFNRLKARKQAGSHLSSNGVSRLLGRHRRQ